MSIQITYISKSDCSNPHERITHVGGNNWYKSEEEVIGEISSITNKKDYHVIINDAIVKIVVARRLGRECLKTERDNISPDDLLSLPELSFNIISGAFVSDNLAHLA